MKKVTYFSAIALIFVSMFLLTCKKEKDSGNLENEVSFTINISNSQKVSALKSASTYSLSKTKKIILTIQNADGTPTNCIHPTNSIFSSL